MIRSVCTHVCVCVCVCVCDRLLSVLTKTVITCKIDYSQALKLRSECTPKHHDCAQIALRLHSQIPELHSERTPDDQDCNPKN